MKFFRDIQGNFRENIDYKITKKDRGGAIIILAPHGGGIERGTSEIVTAIAGKDLSYYLFEGLLPTAHKNRKLHITSTRFDEPICSIFIQGFSKSLAIHGCSGRKKRIYVGGRDEKLKRTLLTLLKARGYPVHLGIGKYAGLFPMNICNRVNSGNGIQLELSFGIRRLLFDRLHTRMGRRTTTEFFTRLISDIREILWNSQD